MLNLRTSANLLMEYMSKFFTYIFVFIYMKLELKYLYLQNIIALSEKSIVNRIYVLTYHVKNSFRSFKTSITYL